ncbi:hypothetical protein Pla8534_29720 [Lignipirellula cremea]|uniref:Uncharacterized protein n=2 Tax=Lignipirellula cremea TaxID=2528010 RepID=A0A518DTJ4_9BACT|nr:hypothetical protein Pla8534_29720 [Lignipirellula cremea]
MVSRLRLYCFLAFTFSGLSAFFGVSYGVVSPYTAAEGLEHAIRGAQTPEEVQSRIADYYSAMTVNRLVLFATPGLAAMIAAALALWELGKLPWLATSGTSEDRRDPASSPLP